MRITSIGLRTRKTLKKMYPPTGFGPEPHFEGPPPQKKKKQQQCLIRRVLDRLATEGVTVRQTPTFSFRDAHFLVQISCVSLKRKEKSCRVVRSLAKHLQHTRSNGHFWFQPYRRTLFFLYTQFKMK